MKLLVSFAVVVVLVGALLSSGDTESSAGGNDPLSRAIRFVRVGSDADYLRRETVFYQIEGDHDVEAWLGFFFSALNTGSWITENDEYAEYSKGPVIPASLVLLACESEDSPQWLLDNDMKAQFNKSCRYQVLVSVEVDSSEIVARGYENWAEEPTTTLRWRFGGEG